MHVLQAVIRFIADRYWKLFWIVFLCLLIPVAKLNRDSKYLYTPSAPHGIFSLQMAANDTAARNIAQQWNHDTINLARSSQCSCQSNNYNYRDPILAAQDPVNLRSIAIQDLYAECWLAPIYFLFILLVMTGIKNYLINASVSIPYLTVDKTMLILTSVPLLACICDLLSSTGVLHYLTGTNSGGLLSMPVCRFLSIVKFGLLGLMVVGYLPVRAYQAGLLTRLSDYLQAKFFQCWRYRVLLGGIVLAALPIWFMDQGQDLLVNINESSMGVGLFIGFIGITAFLNWYLAKLFFANQYQPPLMPVKEPVLILQEELQKEKKASRFLGTISFLIPAFAILKALDAFKISYDLDFFPPSVWLLASLVFVYAILQGDLVRKQYERLPASFRRHGSFLLILLLGLLVIVIPGSFLLLLQWKGKAADIQPASLAYISIDLVLMAVAFLLFVSLRELVFRKPWLTSRIGGPIYFFGSIISFLFLVINVHPLLFASLPFNFLALPVLYTGCIFYTLVFTVLIRVSMWKKINVSFFLFVIFFLLNISIPSRYHNVRLLTNPENKTYNRQRLLSDYFAGWLRFRKNEIDTASGKTYPVFLVNCYGGGIRAAAFSTLVVRQLNDSVAAWQGKEKLFEHFVFSYSGASGGTIGASVLCATRYTSLNRHARIQVSDSMLTAFYNKDYLTPLISGMMGRDLWAAVSGTDWWTDRAVVQERLWEKHLEQDLGIRYEKDFYSYWDTSLDSRYEVPLLFSNSCNVDDGLKGILSPVRLLHEQFPATDFVDAQLDTGSTLALSSAAFLSARFPIISPTGKMAANYHYMDGGIKENSGAETSENIYLALQKWLDAPDSIQKYYPDLLPYLKHIRIYFLSVANSSHSRTEPDKKVENLFQLTSPLIALYNSGVDGNSRKADSTLRSRYPSQYASVWPNVDCIQSDSASCEKYSPALPLGWQISRGALRRLTLSVQDPGNYARVNDSLPGFARLRRIFQP